VAQRVGRGTALLFHDRSTRRGRVVISMPRPHFIPGKDPVPIAQEAGWAPGPVWKSEKSRSHWDSFRDHPVLSSVAIRTELPGPHYYIGSGNIILTQVILNCSFKHPQSQADRQPPPAKLNVLIPLHHLSVCTVNTYIFYHVGMSLLF